MIMDLLEYSGSTQRVQGILKKSRSEIHSERWKCSDSYQTILKVLEEFSKSLEYVGSYKNIREALSKYYSGRKACSQSQNSQGFC